MKLSLISLSLLTAEVLSAPINPNFLRRVHPRSPFVDPDFGFDFLHYGRTSFGPFSRLDGFDGFPRSSSSMPFGSGTISVGSPGAGSGPTFAAPPALDVASAAPGTLPPIPETPVSPPVSPAPVDAGVPVAAVAPAIPPPIDPAAPASPAPVDDAAPVSPASVDGAAPVSPAPVDGAAPVSPVPVDGAAPVSPVPVDGAASVSPAPVGGDVAVSPAPADGAVPANPPNFSEPPPLIVASASPDVAVGPANFQIPDAGTPPNTPGTPPSPDTAAAPGTPATVGTAADLGPIAAVNVDPTNPNSGATQSAIDAFNKDVAPGLEQGHPVDHSGDNDVKIGVDLMNKQHGGRSGITVGNQNLQVGIYRDFNPLKPLDTFDSSVRHRPNVLGIKANF